MNSFEQWGGWAISFGWLVGYLVGRSVEAMKWRAKADALQAKESGGKLYRVTSERSR